MVSTESPPNESFWQKDPFRIVKPEDYETLGIYPEDIIQGTFPALRHPPLLSGRFGGNAYGLGFYEIYEHLEHDDIKLLQSITFDNPERVKEHYKKINHIYKKIGLLIRFSSHGKPYYLIPLHLASTSIAHIKNKSDEISKIIDYHRKKYLKESHKIGLLTNEDDLIFNDLSLRFKEHQFFIIDSPERLNAIDEILDLVILPRDIYRTILLEKIGRRSGATMSKSQLEKHALYMLGRIYKILKPDGEIFIIAHHRPLKTSRTAALHFKSEQEKKNFLLFTHIYKTRKKYQIKYGTTQVNLFDLEWYLGSRYIEQEVIDRLSQGKDLDKLSVEEINNLPYLNLPLDNTFAYDQQKAWHKLLSVYFDHILQKKVVPQSVRDTWKKRFEIEDYSVNYMLIHLAQKKPFDSTIEQIKKDITDSRLAGCPLPLLADYRDSFDYLIRTLKVLIKIKNNRYSSLPEIFVERLREPFENKKQRYTSINDILKLMSKINRLEKIQSYLNPDTNETGRTKLLEHLDVLPFFGCSHGEIREIFLIIVGHSTMGRIISGKMNEKTLKPLSDLARRYEPVVALNLLRYCRLMSMAETLSPRRSDMKPQQLAELFDLFDSTVRVITNRETDWDTLLDEKISLMGGIHNKLIRKLLMMMNHFDFLDNWAELSDKGKMSKESLADYDDNKLTSIENIIGLVRIIQQFENKFLKDNPLQLPIVFRKFLDMEFHGTGHVFEKMDSRLVFILLWLTVNVTRGGVINFNPILADTSQSQMDDRIKKVEKEARFINKDYLDLETLRHFSEQLYLNQSAFIVNTGFRLRINNKTQSMDVTFIDMDINIRQLDVLVKKFKGYRISDIPDEDLIEMEKFFANLEDFYRGHQQLLSENVSGLKVPERQRRWYRKAHELRKHLRENFISSIFDPQNVYTDLDRLFRNSPSILHLVLPEFTALRKVNRPGRLYLRSPIIDHIFTSTRKVQALIRGDLENFQNYQALHKLAQREFGPMAAGIVGFNESQLESLGSIVQTITRNESLFNALIKAFIFQDLGLIPELREKYKSDINSADQAQAGELFLIKEKIPKRYGMDKASEKALIFIIRHHDFIHHQVRGEFSFHSLKEIVEFADKELFNAFFISSLIMFSAMGEDLILEDLASRLFKIKDLCHRIIDGEISLDEYFEEIYIERGRLFFALEEFHMKGLPKGMAAPEYLKSLKVNKSDERRCIHAGKMIYSLERLFRLRGIRYIDFIDLGNLIVKVPLKFIYQKKNYHGIGYATFEKNLFEALRIYNGILALPEDVRHFILQRLDNDQVRIFGFENVSNYLNYHNMIKLLLIALLGSQRFKQNSLPVFLNFLSITEKIDKRYEAVNDFLGNISIEEIWSDSNYLNQYFKAKTGLLLSKDITHRVLSIDFADRINITRKISHMDSISDIDHLKNYYHYSLQSLRKSPFYTDDYELELEDAFYRRLGEVTDIILDQVSRQFELLTDFNEIHHLYIDLMGRSLEIGFSEEQKHRLTDLYELRKDKLRQDKLEEITSLIEAIHDVNELKDYWDGIKWSLFNNRQFLGKEFENLIAKHFDEAIKKIRSMSFQIHFMS